jgi:glycogen debranching enzyme
VNAKIIKNLEEFNINEKYFFTTMNPNHNSFEEKRYWRGPIWINTNWIIYRSLINKNKNFAEKIKKNTIQLINHNNFHEYYSSKTGLPFGANNFSWTAALYLDLVLS